MIGESSVTKLVAENAFADILSAFANGQRSITYRHNSLPVLGRVQELIMDQNDLTGLERTDFNDLHFATIAKYSTQINQVMPSIGNNSNVPVFQLSVEATY